MSLKCHALLAVVVCSFAFRQRWKVEKGGRYKVERSEVAEGGSSPLQLKSHKTKSFSAPFPTKNSSRSSAFSWYLSATTFWPTRNSIRCHVFFKRGQNFSRNEKYTKNVNFEQGKQDWKSSFFMSVGVIDWKLQRWRKVYWVHTSVLFFGILSLSCTNEASTCGSMYYMLKSAFYTLLIELSSWRVLLRSLDNISCYLIIIALKPKACLMRTNFLITLLYLFCQLWKFN